MHPVVVIPLRHLLESSVLILLLGCQHKLMAVLFLQKVLADLSFILLPLVVLGLLSNNRAPLINLTVLVNGVVPFLLVVQVLDRFLFLLNRLLDAISVKLERVNLQIEKMSVK